MIIRVATYNVHKCRGLDRRVDPKRIADIIAALNADVIAIQEILDARNGGNKFEQARTVHRRLEGYKFCFGENRQLHGGAYGNMTLSRFPIRFSQNYDLTWQHRERRGCLRADIVLPNKALLHIFNVHLGTSFLERRHQGRRLVSDAVLNRMEYTGPRIVVGDFNEWTRGLASRLMGKHFQSIEPGRLLRRSRTYPGVLPVFHLDHFYYDSSLSLRSFRLERDRRALIASDHLPLIAEFEIPE